MRIVILWMALMLITPNAWAGSYNVTVDDTQLKEIAGQAKLTPQQVLQRVVDGFMQGQKHAAMNRKIMEVQRACQGGDTKACAEIDSLGKTLGK